VPVLKSNATQDLLPAIEVGSVDKQFVGHGPDSCELGNDGDLQDRHRHRALFCSDDLAVAVIARSSTIALKAGSPAICVGYPGAEEKYSPEMHEKHVY
jgi:hypothetical protein